MPKKYGLFTLGPYSLHLRLKESNWVWVKFYLSSPIFDALQFLELSLFCISVFLFFQMMANSQGVLPQSSIIKVDLLLFIMAGCLTHIQLKEYVPFSMAGQQLSLHMQNLICTITEALLRMEQVRKHYMRTRAPLLHSQAFCLTRTMECLLLDWLIVRTPQVNL